MSAIEITAQFTETTPRRRTVAGFLLAATAAIRVVRLRADPVRVIASTRTRPTAGWLVSPGHSFTVAGPICFDLQSGRRARQLVWQDDVPVNLGA